MVNLKNIYKSNKLLGLLIIAIVIIFGFFIMANPILKNVTISSLISPGFMFLLIILFFLFLPSIIYCIIAIRSKDMEYVIIPAIFLLIAEYYFFHDYSTWISSDPNAAIGLVIAPIFLILILGGSYGIAYIFLKIRKHISRRL